MVISVWQPSELDKQTQIAKQALARIAELEARLVRCEELRGEYHRLLMEGPDRYRDRAEQAEAELKEVKWQLEWLLQDACDMEETFFRGRGPFITASKEDVAKKRAELEHAWERSGQ